MPLSVFTFREVLFPIPTCRLLYALQDDFLCTVQVLIYIHLNRICMPMVWDFFLFHSQVHTHLQHKILVHFVLNFSFIYFFFPSKLQFSFFSGYNLLQTIRSVQIFIDVFCIGGILEANQYVVDTGELEDQVSQQYALQCYKKPQ